MMKKSKIHDSLWCAVGYAFSCGLNTAAVCALFVSKQFWPMLVCLICMIFTACMADEHFRAVKKILDKIKSGGSLSEDELKHILEIK